MDISLTPELEQFVQERISAGEYRTASDVTARRELDRIWEYIACDDESAANRVIQELLDTSRLLARMPGIGVPRPEYGRALHSFPVGNHLIFYREIAGGIHISHFVHGARDLPRFFGKR
jgi:toxin ParE1/3/4